MTSELWLGVAIIILLLAFSGFFSGSETALTAASRAQLKIRAEKGDKKAKVALSLTEDKEDLLGAILLGNNFVNTLATSMASSILVSVFSDNGVALATFVMTAAILIFSELMPKTFAIANSVKMARAVAIPMRWITIILKPLVIIVNWIVQMLLRLLGVREKVRHDNEALDEIAGAIELGASEGDVDREDRNILIGALDLRNRDVEEIMTHRSNIEMIDQNTPPAELIERVLASPYTRLPIYKDDPENVVGLLHAKELLREVNRLLVDGGKIEDLDVMQVAIEPYFIPETTSLDDQLEAFLSRSSHFALAIDEYGSLQGLITLEDILEEIVGEISDEYDQGDENEYQKRADGAYILDGSLTIRDANRQFAWNLPDDNANTVAGLVINEAQQIPRPDQKFNFFGYRFEILERERNRISKLAVRKIDE